MSYQNHQYLQELTKKQQEEMMSVDFFSNRELRINKYEKAYVLPTIKVNNSNSWRVGGVLDKNKNYIEESGQYAYGERTRVYGSYAFSNEDVEYIDEEVIYLNNYINQWGHFLLDVIGRLWYALNNNIRIVYTNYLNTSNKIQGNFLELIKLLGIDENRLLYVNKVTVFKSVIIPDTSICTAKFYTKEYIKLIDKIVNMALNGYTLRKDRKVYCSRRHFTSKRTIEYGEENIEKIFLHNNYEIIYMEELPLIDQIRLLNECKEIVSISGTLVHNAMFIKNENCNFTVINKMYNINENIYLTNQISNASFVFVDAYLSPLPISKGKGPYIIAVSNELIKYCYDNAIDIEIPKVNIKKQVSKYYYSYLKKYYRKLIKFQSIEEAINKKNHIKFRDIRKHYRFQLNYNKKNI